jgi:hypothetical protein
MGLYLFADCFSTGDVVSQADVDKLREEVKEFVLASHLHWVLWGLLSVRLYHIYCDQFYTLTHYTLLLCFCLMYFTRIFW